MRSEVQVSITSLRAQGCSGAADDDEKNKEEGAVLQENLLTVLSELLHDLSDDAESLEAGTLKHMKDAAEISAALELTDLAEKLTELHRYEATKPPVVRAGDVLSKRQPDFLFFSQDDRNLKSEYDLNKFFREEHPQKKVYREDVPTALQNLAQAAELDLAALHTSQSNDDRGKVRTLLERAESKITRLVQESWTQSKLWISLELDGFRLPSIEDDDSVIEDYVRAESYIAAVSKELKRSGCSAEISEEDIARPNRPEKLEQWCKAKAVNTPGKRVIAYHLVENQYDSPIVDMQVLPNLKKLLQDIHAALGI